MTHGDRKVIVQTRITSRRSARSSADRSTGQQASDLEHGMRIGATRQNIRSRAPWAITLVAHQDVPNGGSRATVATGDCRDA
jgi:hypothetical protein